MHNHFQPDFVSDYTKNGIYFPYEYEKEFSFVKTIFTASATLPKVRRTNGTPSLPDALHLRQIRRSLNLGCEISRLSSRG